MKLVQEILQWGKQVSDIDLLIKADTLSFNVKMDRNILPHLLGLHYMNSSKENLKGIRLFNKVVKEKYTDKEIFDKINKNNHKQLENVRNRIHYFKEFMYNMDKARIVEQTNQRTKIKSHHLLVQSSDNKYLQLGIARGEITDYFETFIILKKDDYFHDTTINEQVTGIYRYDDECNPIPFSFNPVKAFLLAHEYNEKRYKEDKYIDGKLILTKEERAKSTIPNKVKILLCFLIIASLFFINGCGKNSIDREKVDLGLIITTAQDYKSEILWFDLNLDSIQKQKLSYAMLATPFYSPAVNNNKIYLIPKGLGNRKDTRKVISIDKQSLDVEEYPFTNIALNHMASIGNNVYVINTLNGDSYLESYDVVSKKRNSIVLEKLYLHTVIASSGKLFCFISKLGYSDSEEPKDRLNVYTPSLDLEAEIDITEYGTPTRMYLEDEDNLYVTVNTYDYTPGKILKINKSTFEISEFATKGNPYNIFKFGDKFILTYFNPVTVSGTEVSIWDESGNEQIFDLGMTLTVAGVMNDRLVAANNESIKMFSLPDFKLIKEYELNIGTSNYVSGLLFVNE